MTKKFPPGSQAVIQATIDALSAHVCVLDSSGAIVMINRAWRAFAIANPPSQEEGYLGFNYLVTCDLASGSSVDGAGAFAEGLRSVLCGDLAEFHLEYPCHSPDEKRWFIGRVTPYMDQDPYRLLVVHENITQRKLAEISLADREDRLRLALQGANDGLWDWNIQTGEVYYSPRWKSMVGYADHELPNVFGTWDNLLHPDDYALAKSRFNNLLSGQIDRYEAEFRLRHKDGHYVDVLSRAFLIQRDDGGMARVVGTHVDISARKQVERALIASEAKFRSYIENASIPILASGKGGQFVDANQAALNLLEYDAPAFMKLSLHDIIPAADLPILEQGLADLNNQKPFETEIRQVTRTGKELWVVLRAMKLSDYRYLFFCQDITERRATWELVRNQKTMLDSAIQVAHLGYWEYDLDSDQFTFNDSFYAIFHTTVEAVGGYHMSSQEYGRRFVYPEDRKLLITEVQNVLNRTAMNYAAQIEHRIIYADGSVGYILVQVSSIRDEQGRLIKTVGVNQDITARKLAELEARNRAHRFEVLVQISQALSIPTKDYEVLLGHPAQLSSQLIDGACAFRLLTEDQQWLSPAALSVIGKDRRNVAESLPYLAMLPAMHGANGIAIREGQIGVYAHLTQEQVADLIHPSTFAWLGSRLVTEMVVAPLKAEGVVIGVLTMYRFAEQQPFSEEEIQTIGSIADRAGLAIENVRLFEQAQRQNADLEQRVLERTEDLQRSNYELARASRAKDEFLATMSHELRTPLNAILSYSEALQDGIYGELSDKQVSKLLTISESGGHLLNLINDILDISKVESGTLNFEFSTVIVSDLCQSCMRLVRPMAEKKGQQIGLNLDPLVTRIQGNERYLKQMLVNLLNNAVKFTPEAGRVGLDVVGNPEHGVVEFSVWDTGIGIAAEEIGRLFQPFVQIDSRLSRRYEGTGLGLALALHIAERHGGSISVISTVGVGSRFTVTLPWREVEKPPIQDLADAISDSETDPALNRKVTLLLAEDNPANFYAYNEYLTAKNYHVVGAENGIEAIRAVHREHPDLVLMDIQMPVMDGLEAIRRLRKDPLTKAIPIFALTALAMPGDRERCLSVGADEYLTKPVRLGELVALIDQHLNNPEGNDPKGQSAA